MKRKFSSMGRVAIALVLALSLSMVMVVPVAAAALENISVSPDDNTAGATGVTYTIAFDTATQLAVAAVTDQIIITFPAGFDATAALVDEATLTQSAEDPTIASKVGAVVTLDVAADEPAGTQSIVLSGIVNTNLAGVAYTVNIETNDAEVAPNTIDGPEDSPAFAIVAGALDAYLVEPAADPQTAGTAFDVVITAVDEFVNPLGTAYTTAGPYEWDSDAVEAPNGATPDIGTLEAVDFIEGVATKSVTLYAAEAAVTFTVTDDNDVTNDSAAIAVVHGALGAYTVVPALLIQEIGTQFDVTITAVDDYENRLGADYDTDPGPYTWTTTAANATNGTIPFLVAPDFDGFANGDADNIDLQVTLRYAEAGVTFTLTDFNAITGTSSHDPVFVEGTNLDKVFYRIGDDAVVTVLEDLANENEFRTDTLEVTASSEPTGDEITLTLSETSANTSEFTGILPLVATVPEPGPGQLAVADLDTILVDAENVPDATATVDMSGPEFTANTTALATYYKNGDPITLTVTLNEIELTVTANFSSFDNEYDPGNVTVDDEGDNTYTVTYTISDNTTADGAYIISVDAEDAAGNSAVAGDYTPSVSVTLDNTAPEVISAEATPLVVQPGTPTPVTFSANVTDGEGSGVGTVTVDLLSIEGSATQVMEQENGGLYTYVWADLDIAAQDTYVLTITATDALGNSDNATAISLQVIADIEAPAFTVAGVFYPVGFESARVGEDVIIYAVVSDNLTTVQSVTINATAIGLSDSENLEEVTANTYSANLTVGGGATVGIKTLTITATDFADNSATANVTVEVVVALTAYNIWLNDGWNLISLPLMSSENCSVVLAGLSSTEGETIPDIVSVWGYDPNLPPESAWLSYFPGGPLPTLTQMTHGCGYWVDVEYAVDAPPAFLTIYGTELPVPPALPPAYEVVTGWNLIGFKETVPMLAENYLAGITDSVVRIYGFWEGYYTVQLGEGVEEMKPGHGYWLAVTEPGTIYP